MQKLEGNGTASTSTSSHSTTSHSTTSRAIVIPTKQAKKENLTTKRGKANHAANQVITPAAVPTPKDPPALQGVWKTLSQTPPSSSPPQAEPTTLRRILKKRNKAQPTQPVASHVTKPSIQTDVSEASTSQPPQCLSLTPEPLSPSPPSPSQSYLANLSSSPKATTTMVCFTEISPSPASSPRSIHTGPRVNPPSTPRTEHAGTHDRATSSPRISVHEEETDPPLVSPKIASEKADAVVLDDVQECASPPTSGSSEQTAQAVDRESLHIILKGTQDTTAQRNAYIAMASPSLSTAPIATASAVAQRRSSLTLTETVLLHIETAEGLSNSLKEKEAEDMQTTKTLTVTTTEDVHTSTPPGSPKVVYSPRNVHGSPTTPFSPKRAGSTDSGSSDVATKRFAETPSEPASASPRAVKVKGTVEQAAVTQFVTTQLTSGMSTSTEMQAAQTSGVMRPLALDGITALPNIPTQSSNIERVQGQCRQDAEQASERNLQELNGLDFLCQKTKEEMDQLIQEVGAYESEISNKVKTISSSGYQCTVDDVANFKEKNTQYQKLRPRLLKLSAELHSNLERLKEKISFYQGSLTQASGSLEDLSLKLGFNKTLYTSILEPAFAAECTKWSNRTQEFTQGLSTLTHMDGNIQYWLAQFRARAVPKEEEALKWLTNPPSPSESAVQQKKPDPRLQELNPDLAKIKAAQTEIFTAMGTSNQEAREELQTLYTTFRAQLTSMNTLNREVSSFKKELKDKVEAMGKAGYTCSADDIREYNLKAQHYAQKSTEVINLCEHLGRTSANFKKYVAEDNKKFKLDSWNIQEVSRKLHIDKNTYATELRPLWEKERTEVWEPNARSLDEGIFKLKNEDAEIRTLFDTFRTHVTAAERGVMSRVMTPIFGAVTGVVGWGVSQVLTGAQHYTTPFPYTPINDPKK